MPKKRVAVSLRKPSPAPEAAADTNPLGVVARIGASDAPTTPVEAATIEAFVSGVAEAVERAVNETPRAQMQNLIRRGPDGSLELTLYLPEQLVQDLSLHCTAHHLDMNRLLVNLVEQHLRGASASASEHLAAAARLLLGQFARRVQTLLATRRRAWVSVPSAAPTAS